MIEKAKENRFSFLEIHGNMMKMMLVMVCTVTTLVELQAQTGIYTLNGGYLTPGGVNVGVEEVTGNSQPAFTLSQNYPNPFNSSTVISFILNRPASVVMILSNMMGQNVRVLDKGYQQAGTYIEQIDASGLNHGICYYSLLVDGAVQTKKMIVN